MEGRPVTLSTQQLDGHLLIPDLLHAAPAARSVLDRYGLRGCGGPDGPAESLAYFARVHDVPLDQLLGELRHHLHSSPAPTESPPRPEDSIYRPFFLSAIAVTLTAGAVWGAYLLLRIGW